MQADTECASNQPSFHPLFSSEGDIILTSKDGVLFRVPISTLKMTSSWFRTMFSLPQTSTTSTDDTVTSNGSRSSDIQITLDEDSRTLEHFLRMVCGLAIPELDSWDVIDPLLYAAEKYDTPGPVSIVRALIRTQPFLDSPLHLYAAACRWGWEPEARLASTLTLALDIHAPEHRPALLKLKTASLLALTDLRHSRREQFRTRLNQHPFLTEIQMSDGFARCPRCADPLDYAAWRELKLVMVVEIDRNPSGESFKEGLETWPAARACWAAKCKKVGCASALYDKALTTRVIWEAINALPNIIEEGLLFTVIMVFPVYSPPANPSPNVQRVLAYAAALNEWDYDKVMECFDDTLEHHILPESMGEPVRNKESYKAHLKSTMPLFKEFKITIHELVEGSDAITLHSSSTGLSIFNTSYDNEYALFVRLVPPKDKGSLPKFGVVKEFVDSKFTVQFLETDKAKAEATATKGTLPPK
ncbi:hypothetical protein EW146_g215 [Bondarzewia mesenterica]|uniref:SnoaL-like domain-containing protein n=1 Tax=Bondarzewia mesenterica TaxID=1095465 RepID=A0A4S4M998_9AGAM|nr:hypothetical protein EW146_g215 [Bondarzewia mesenterica]